MKDSVFQRNMSLIMARSKKNRKETLYTINILYIIRVAWKPVN